MHLLLPCTLLLPLSLPPNIQLCEKCSGIRNQNRGFAGTCSAQMDGFTRRSMVFMQYIGSPGTYVVPWYQKTTSASAMYHTWLDIDLKARNRKEWCFYNVNWGRRCGAEGREDVEDERQRMSKKGKLSLPGYRTRASSYWHHCLCYCNSALPPSFADYEFLRTFGRRWRLKEARDTSAPLTVVAGLNSDSDNELLKGVRINISPMGTKALRASLELSPAELFVLNKKHKGNCAKTVPMTVAYQRANDKGKKDYTLCFCRSYDCKEQTWQAKDGQIKKGGWYHRGMVAKHMKKDKERQREGEIPPPPSRDKGTNAISTEPREMPSKVVHVNADMLNGEASACQNIRGQFWSNQYYAPAWFNNRPSQAHTKLEAKLIVTFVPGSSNFFSWCSDNALSVEDLTAKYGAQVFVDYDLDYEKVKSTKAGLAANATSDDEDGDSVGSQDSDDEGSLGDQESMGSFLSESDGGEDDDAEFVDEGQDTGGQGEQMASDDEEGHRAAFAAEFDIPMDLETEIFGGSGDESI
ncbi:hypothetical protein C8R44DRAFT_742091 [Mycena epipterygia]|nr:hypothetical protein C8R44DRAFT_742091 [Mycena epipterygia]